MEAPAPAPPAPELEGEIAALRGDVHDVRALLPAPNTHQTICGYAVLHGLDIDLKRAVRLGSGRPP